MKKLIFTLSLCLIFIGVYAQNYSWTRMPSLGQTLYGTASFTVGDNIYVIGGWKVSVVQYGGYPVPLSHQVYAFNTVSNTWSQKNDFPGTAIYGASAFTIGNYGYIVNGWDSTGSGHGPSTTWQYNPTTDSWTAKAPFTGSTRYTTGCFVLNGKGYITCGFSPYVNDMFCYDPAVDSWSQKSSFPGSPRQAMVAFSLGNTAYAGMGATGDGRGSYFLESDWYKYNDVTDTWTQLNPFPGDAVDAAYNFEINGEEYVVGGLTQSSVYYSNSVAPSNKVWKYTPASDTWTLWGVFPDTTRFGGGANGQSSSAGYLGFGASNFSNYPLTDKFYRFGQAAGPYSCAMTIGQLEISNAVYNFQANGNFSPTAQITWHFGDGHSASGSSVIHNYTAAGSYTATAYIQDSASSCSDSITTTVSVTNVNSCSVAINQTSFGQAYTLSASVSMGAGPYTYLWSCSSNSSFSSNSPDPFVTIPVNSNANYCVTVTDTTGCVASACQYVSDSLVTYTPCQVYLFVYPDSAVPGDYYGILYTASTTSLSYLWDFGDGTTSYQMFPSHTYATPGRYTICLSVSDSAGCSYSFCDSSFYSFKYGGGPMASFNAKARWVLGVNDLSTSSALAVYPNPSDGILHINAAGQQIDNATIYDLNGQQVATVSSPQQNKIDVSALTDGIYFMQLKIKDASTRIKFVKAGN